MALDNYQCSFIVLTSTILPLYNYYVVYRISLLMLCIFETGKLKVELIFLIRGNVYKTFDNSFCHKAQIKLI